MITWWQLRDLDNHLQDQAKGSINNYYYTFSSLTIFWLAESLQWIFEISARDVKTCRLYNNLVKVMGNRVMCDCSAWFLRVVPFVLFAVREEVKIWLLDLLRWPSKTSKKIVEDKDHFFVECIIKQLLRRFGFCDIQNNQGLVKGYQPRPWASADNPHLDLDYSGYHKNLIQ